MTACATSAVLIYQAQFFSARREDARESISFRGLESPLQLHDDEPIHIAQSLCISDGLSMKDAGLTSLRSILAARAAGTSLRRYVIHLFVDISAGWLISFNRSATMPSARQPWGEHREKLQSPDSMDLFHEQWGDVIAHIDSSGGLVELRVHAEDDAYAAVEAMLGAGATRGFNHDGFKRCAPLRLLLPFVPGIADASRVVYVDLDVLVLCNPQQLWDVFESWTKDMWLGVAPESRRYADPGAPPPAWPLPSGPQFRWGGVNSGVLLMHLDRIRAHAGEYWDAVMRVVRERGYLSPRFESLRQHLPELITGNTRDGMAYYDQDIMNIMSFDWPERFFVLPRRFNWRWRPGRDVPPEEWGAEAGVCVEHFANRDFGVGGSSSVSRAPLWEYWRHYRRIYPAGAVSERRLERGSGAPAVPWEWEPGVGRSIGPMG